LGTDDKEGSQPVRYAPTKEPSKMVAKDCLDHSIQYSFERASVKEDRRILAEAYRHSIGHKHIGIEEITELFKKDERIIRVNEKGRIRVNEKGRMVCTTKEVLSEEKRMVELAQKGKGQIIPSYKADELSDLELNGEQAEAVKHVLTTHDRVSIIRGAAGTGKTTLMRAAISRLEKAGKNVTVLAPTSQASRGVLRDEGFEQAETVAKFLVDKELQQKTKGQVIWVDEAGLLGTKDMTDILQVATEQKAQLVLGGDTRQHASVVRGDALRILNTVGRIKTAEVSRIYRQTNQSYKQAVEDLSQGNVKSGYSKLDEMGAIEQVDALSPNEKLVADYIDTIKRSKTAIVISPTHQHGKDVTEAIRDRLKENGLIGSDEKELRKLTNLNLTEAEKKDSRKKGLAQPSKWPARAVQSKCQRHQARQYLDNTECRRKRHYDFQ